MFDETSDKIRLYMDGNLAHEGSWGSQVSKVNPNLETLKSEPETRDPVKHEG